MLDRGSPPSSGRENLILNENPSDRKCLKPASFNPIPCQVILHPSDPNTPTSGSTSAYANLPNFDTKEKLDDLDFLQSVAEPKCDTEVNYEEVNGRPPQYGINALRSMGGDKVSTDGGRKCEVRYEEPISDDEHSNSSSTKGKRRKKKSASGRNIEGYEGTSRTGGELNSEHTETETCFNGSTPKHRGKSRKKYGKHLRRNLMNPRYSNVRDKLSRNGIIEENEESEESNPKESSDDSKDSNDSNFKRRHKYKSFDSVGSDDQTGVGNESDGEDPESPNSNEIGDNLGNKSDDSDQKCGGCESEQENDVRSESSSSSNGDRRGKCTSLLKPPKSGVSRVATMETLNPHVSR